MLNAGEKNSNSCVVRKKFLNETKNHNPPPPPPPPLQVKWSVPNIELGEQRCYQYSFNLELYT